MMPQPAYGKTRFFNYLLLGLLVATTGFPLFYSSQEFIFIGFLVAIVVFFNRNLGFEKNLIYVLLAFFIVETLQALLFGSFNAVTIAGTLIRIAFGYFVVRVLARSFFDYYFKFIYFLAVTSLIFYCSSLMITGFYDFFVRNITPGFVSPFAVENAFYSTPPNIIVFCFHDSLITSLRNSGPFWEPGAFSIFLILAIMFRLIQHKKMLEKKLIVLYIALITTFSTAGIIALFILLIGFYLSDQRRKEFRYFFASIFIAGSLLIWFNVSFLSEKTETDILIAESTTSSRFGSALVDLKDFANNPFIGWGRGEHRYGGQKSVFFTVDQHRNNGVTNLLATYGIFIFLFYFYLYYRNLKNLCRYYLLNTRFAVFALIVILLLGFSQGVFTRPFFYGLLFLGIPITFGATAQFNAQPTNPVQSRKP